MTYTRDELQVAVDRLRSKWTVEAREEVDRIAIRMYADGDLSREELDQVVA